MSQLVQRLGMDGIWTLALSNLIIVSTLAVSFLPALLFVMRKAINSPSTTCCEALLVLGEKLQNNLPGSNYAARLERALAVCQGRAGCKVFIVGGITGRANISESACGKNYFQQKSITKTHIIIEDRSRHTLENLYNVRVLLEQDGIDQIAIITNRFHLARAGVLASGLSLRFELCAAEEKFQHSLWQWLALFKEAYFIHWYFTGKYWSILTRNQTSLDRLR